jgi:hypothetical protein
MKFDFFRGGFMLIATPQHSEVVIDFREVAPQSSTWNMFNKSAERAQEVHTISLTKIFYKYKAFSIFMLIGFHAWR